MKFVLLDTTQCEFKFRFIYVSKLNHKKLWSTIHNYNSAISSSFSLAYHD